MMRTPSFPLSKIGNTFENLRPIRLAWLTTTPKTTTWNWTTQVNSNNQLWWSHNQHKKQLNMKDRLWILWLITPRCLHLQRLSHGSPPRDSGWISAPKELLCLLIGQIQWVQSISSVKRKRGVSSKRVLKIQILRATIEHVMLFSELARKIEVLRVHKKKWPLVRTSPRNRASRICFPFPSSKFRCPNCSEPMLLPISRSLSVRVSAQKVVLNEFLKMRESIALRGVSACVLAKHLCNPWPLLMEATPTKKPVLIPFLGSSRECLRNRTGRKEISKKMETRENFSLKWGKIWR